MNMQPAIRDAMVAAIPKLRRFAVSAGRQQAMIFRDIALMGTTSWTRQLSDTCPAGLRSGWIRTHARGAGEHANERGNSRRPGGGAMHIPKPDKHRDEQFTHALIILMALATVLLIGAVVL